MIRFDRVTIQLGTRRILDEEDFRLHLGMPHIILGESGSGKTPVLKVMLGLIRPRTGSVYLNGIDIASLPEKDILPLRQKVAMVFQSGALFDSLTVGENVGYRLFEAHRDTREVESIVREKLHLVGLEDAINLYPAELSGGMAKRVAMARALAASPEVILFDEPTEGLDPIAVYNLNRFSILKDGKFLFQGTRDELEQTENEHIQEFLHPTKVSLNEWASGQAPGQLSVPIGPG